MILGLLLVGSLSALLLIVSDDSTSIDVRSTLGCLLFSALVFVCGRAFFDRIVGIVESPPRLYFAFFFVYYGLGLLPISSYRDYIDFSQWVAMLAVAAIAFISGSAIVGSAKSGRERARAVARPRLAIAAVLLAVSTACAIAIVVQHGFVLSNPEERFSVSAKLSYAVEICIPVVLTLFAYSVQRSKVGLRSFALPAFFFVVLLTLGYRNQPMLLLAGVILVLMLSSNAAALLRRHRIGVMALVSLGVFFLGTSYLLRTNSSSVGRTLDWSSTVATYDVAFPEFTLPLIPLHLASREGMGVSQTAVDRIDEVEGFTSRAGFFFLDFTTMLPGRSLTSGRILGMVVNGSETSSLTPSLIGGLWVSFGVPGVALFFFVAGLALRRLHSAYVSSRSPLQLSMLVVLSIYLIELTNRGIFKPMYILAGLAVLLVGRPASTMHATTQSSAT